MKHKISVGDRVAYSAAFLRSVQDYSFESASRRGVVISLKQFPQMKYPIAKIRWENEPPDELTAGALVCNLVTVAAIPFET